MLISFDTEDDSKGNPFIINFYDGITHTTFQGKSDQIRLQAWEYINNVPEKTMFWACNLEYDLINVFGEWISSMVSLFYVKSGLIKAHFKDRKCTFYDTFRHWPISVKGMGEYIGKPKLEPGVDFNNPEYCRRDTEIVYDFVELMLKRYTDEGLTVKTTLPAMALQKFKKDFYPGKLPELPVELQGFFREGYFGGRVEVFNQSEITGKIYHYDFNSLYPSVMNSGLYPDLTEYKITNKLNLEYEGMADCVIEISYNKICAVPKRVTQGTIYPYGRIRGVYTYPEFRQIISDGGKIIKCYFNVEFQKTVKPFSEYVLHCYTMRQKAKQEGNKLDDIYYKLMMNSLYGKFAQNSEILVIANRRQYTIEGKAKHVNVIWAAYVTAYGRLKLLSGLRSCSEVFYCDTDSIFTKDILNTSDNLGDLKLENIYSKTQFHGNKIYKVDSKAIAKGIPKNVADDFIRTGRAVFVKPARYRESLRTGAIANYWYDTEKELRAEYIKRQSIEGELRSWNIADYNIKHESDFAL